MDSFFINRILRGGCGTLYVSPALTVCHAFLLLGAVFQYWRSTRDDMVRQKNGKLEEHRVLTRRRL